MPSGYSDDAKKQGIRKTDPKIQPPNLGFSWLVRVALDKTTKIVCGLLGIAVGFLIGGPIGAVLLCLLLLLTL